MDPGMLRAVGKGQTGEALVQRQRQRQRDQEAGTLETEPDGTDRMDGGPGDSKSESE